MNSLCCSSLKISPLFDIEEGCYTDASIKLKNHFNDVDSFKKMKIPKNVQDPNKLPHEILMRYIQCRKNMRCWIGELSDLNGFKSIISHKINLNENGVRAGLFQTYSVRNWDDATKKIDIKIPGDLYLLFYDGYYEPKSDGMFKSNTFIETVLVAKIFLHNENKHYLENCNLNRIIKLKKSFGILNRYIFQLYRNYSQLEQESICIKGGASLLPYGTREISDVDCSYDGNYFDRKNMLNKRLKMDIYNVRENTPYTLSIMNKIKPICLDTNNIYEDYVYFMGLKMHNYEFTTKFLYIRSRPKAFADMIYFSKRVTKIPIPQIPNLKILKSGPGILKNEYVTDFTVEFLKGRYRDNTLKNKDKQKIDKKKFINAIRNYLRKGYGLVMSETGIQKTIDQSLKYEI